MRRSSIFTLTSYRKEQITMKKTSNKNKSTAAAATKEEAVQPVADQVNAENAAGIAEEDALKAQVDADAKAEQAEEEATATEEPKQEAAATEMASPATSHPQMCDEALFGTFDPESDSCKDCLKDFAECATACATLKAFRNIKPVKAAKAPKVPKEGGTPRTRKGNIILISAEGTGAGEIDKLLLRPEGCTMEEMLVHRGAVSSHLSALVRAGFHIVHEGGRYYHRKAAPAPAAEEKAAA